MNNDHVDNRRILVVKVEQRTHTHGHTVIAYVLVCACVCLCGVFLWIFSLFCLRKLMVSKRQREKTISSLLLHCFTRITTKFKRIRLKFILAILLPYFIIPYQLVLSSLFLHSYVYCFSIVKKITKPFWKYNHIELIIAYGDVCFVVFLELNVKLGIDSKKSNNQPCLFFVCYFTTIWMNIVIVTQNIDDKTQSCILDW